MALLHTDYFELKALEKKQMQKGYSELPSLKRKTGDEIPMWKISFLYQNKRHSYLQGQEVEAERSLYKQTLLN